MLKYRERLHWIRSSQVEDRRDLQNRIYARLSLGSFSLKNQEEYIFFDLSVDVERELLPSCSCTGTRAFREHLSDGYQLKLVVRCRRASCVCLVLDLYLWPAMRVHFLLFASFLRKTSSRTALEIESFIHSRGMMDATWEAASVT